MTGKRMLRWISIALIGALALLACVSAFMENDKNGGNIVIPEISYITKYEIPENDAMDFLKKMGIGWNLGNTFDANNDSWGKNREMDLETAWVGVKTTEELIKTVHAAGFDTIRIPVSWHNHVDMLFNITPEWLDRVQEVVDYAINDGMYVILNTHHDVYSKYYYPTSEHYDTAHRYITTIWKQLTERFKDYDERLIFESMNEPRMKDTSYEWSFNASSPECLDSADCINKLNQAFVDVVRASGGNNADRYLMVPAYCASPENALSDYFTLPTDSADNKIIVSVHAYTPYPFALQDGGDKTFELTNIGQTAEINRFMNSLYKKFIVNGIPVVIGEFGARAKGDNLQSRVNFAAYYCVNASARNIPCVWWDNHAFKGNGELFGVIDRAKCEIVYPEIVEALVKYGGYDAVPEKK